MIFACIKFEKGCPAHLARQPFVTMKDISLNSCEITILYLSLVNEPVKVGVVLTGSFVGGGIHTDICASKAFVPQ